MFPHHEFLAVVIVNGRFVTRFQMAPILPEEEWPQYLTRSAAQREVMHHHCGPDESYGMADYINNRMEDAA